MKGLGFNAKHAAIAVVLILVSWVIAVLASRYFLTQMYEGTSLPALNELLTNKAEKPLAYYLNLIRAPIAAAHLLLIVLAAVWLTRLSENAWVWLVLLLIGDGLLLAYSINHGGPLLNIAVDWSIPEMYQYLKELLIAVFLFLLYRNTRQSGFLVFAAIALFLLVDDSLKYHETAGHLLAPYLSTTSLPSRLGAAPNFVGELMSLLPLLLVAPFGLISFLKAPNKARLQMVVLGVFLVALFLFGVIIDFLGNSSVS
ncbi:MAG: hypothetical protein ACR2PS_01655, partial [Pseudomonadales bacterium]